MSFHTIRERHGSNSDVDARSAFDHSMSARSSSDVESMHTLGVQRAALIRHVSVANQYHATATQVSTNIQPLPERARVSSPYASAPGVLSSASYQTAPRSGTAVDSFESGQPARSTSRAALRTRFAMYREATSSAGSVTATAEVVGSCGLTVVPVVTATSRSELPPTSALSSSVIPVAHATCEGPFSTVLLDLIPGESARVSRSGSALAVCVPLSIGTCRASDPRVVPLMTTAANRRALHPLDETDIGQVCSAFESGVHATAVTLYLSARTLTIAWNAPDAEVDRVVDGARLPLPGSLALPLGEADDVVVLQCPVLDDFSWAVEPVR